MTIPRAVGIVPNGFIGFINKLQMTAFGGFVGQVLWFFGSIVLTLVDAYLLTRRADPIPLAEYAVAERFAQAVSIFTAHNAAAEQMRQVGVWLAGILVGGWLGKSINNTVGNKIVRESATEYAPVAQAKAMGKAMGKGPVVQAEHVETVEAGNGDTRDRA